MQLGIKLEFQDRTLMLQMSHLIFLNIYNGFNILALRIDQYIIYNFLILFNLKYIPYPLISLIVYKCNKLKVQ